MVPHLNYPFVVLEQKTQHYFFPTHVPTGSFKVPHLSCLASSLWSEVRQQSDIAHRFQFCLSLSPEVSDSCRFFGPSLPAGCLTVPRCHGNRGCCDSYAAEVFLNLTPWRSLSLSLILISFQVVEMMSAADDDVCICLHHGDTAPCPACSFCSLTFHQIEALAWRTGESSRGDQSTQTTVQKQPQDCANVSVCGKWMHVQLINSEIYNKGWKCQTQSNTAS